MLNRFIAIFCILLLSIQPGHLHALSYDKDVLEIYANLLPRFVLMSSNKKEIKKSLEICIVHDKVDEQMASMLVNMIEEKYPNGIKSLQIKGHLAAYDAVTECKSSHILFLFNTSTAHIQNTLLFSKEHRQLTISYDPLLLSLGVHLSLFLGRKIVPYVNLQALKENGIEVDNILLNISRIYTKENQ